MRMNYKPTELSRTPRLKLIYSCFFYKAIGTNAYLYVGIFT